ncbi:MAG TPA: xanthine dehydrogenase family protein molybdopterin-binding subunit [Stellaceae bacterium]|nr:xanthine dehydrogenase family protein molybdopterin-binding subunit [Stellaceae bacterium]
MAAPLFGTSVPRLEDGELLRGAGRFVDDIVLPSMAAAAFVRSPHPHAAINGIDAAAALAVPGVHAVLALADIAPLLRTTRLATALPSPSYRLELHRPVLADGEVVHVGEPVALVIASNRYVAEDAAALVAVDYEVLPAVGDCRAALGADAPRAHRTAPHNLAAEFEMGYGDVDRAFAAAAHVFAETFWQHRGGSHSLECRGTLAHYDTVEDRLTLWSSTQAPHAARTVLADMLGRDENRLRVVTPDVGGGFGPKLVVYPEDVAVAVAALMLRRPVKWIEDRREHFVATTQERDQYWAMEIAVDAAARILGVRGRLIHDHGAYTARGVNVPFGAAQALPLPYEVPAYHLAVCLAVTNKVPVTPVRGAGQPQGAFVMERLIDRVARELKIDRAELRRRHLVPAAHMPRTTPLKTRGGIAVVLDSGDYPRCQELALAAAGWAEFPRRQHEARAAGRHIGIGVANFVEGTGRGPFEGVTVRIGPSGKVLVFTGAAAMGQGLKTILAQIVADALGGDAARIAVTAGDSAGIAQGIGGFNSRQAVMAGNSAHLAARELHEKVLKIAAHLIEAAEDDLEIAGDRVHVKGASALGVSLAEVARAVAGMPGYTLPPGVTPGLEATAHMVVDAMAYANGTAVAEVEVDIETGHVAILRLVLAHDCGRAINPMLVAGQISGGAAHGIGNALYEWMGFDADGQPSTVTLGEYLLVTASEMPPLVLVHQESPSPLNPLGVKGVGESGVIPTPAAIVAAIEDALSPFGVRIAQAPIRPHEIVALIAAARRR